MFGVQRPVALAVLAVALSLALLASADSALAAGNSITSPDSGDVEGYTSLALDAAGNPVVSYHSSGGLTVLHCDDANCAGGGESVTFPDAAWGGQFTSLALDAIGNPVVSYSNGYLKVIHCNDANCAGSDESISTADTGANVADTSLALDALGNPVVSYYDANPNWDLKVLHCNDANCTGGDESITSPDTAGEVGGFASVVLDALGKPVVGYYDQTNDALKLLHCGNPNCTAGNSITSPDTGGVGSETSIAMDAGGNPVVSYWDIGNGDLKVMHCNDANCTGGDESITAPDTIGGVGVYTSLKLDAGGNPVVSYGDVSNYDLKVLHCNDANCVGGGESVTSPDSDDFVGLFTSLALDGSGNPVVSYWDGTNGALKILHCGDPTCKAAAPPAPTPTGTPPSVGGISLDPASSSGGAFDLRMLIVGLVAAAMAAAASSIAWRRR